MFIIKVYHIPTTYERYFGPLNKRESECWMETMSSFLAISNLDVLDYEIYIIALEDIREISIHESLVF